MASTDMAQFLCTVKGETIAQKLFSRGIQAVAAWEDASKQRLKMARKRSAACGNIEELREQCIGRPGAISMLCRRTVVVDLDVKDGVDGIAWWLRTIGPLPTRARVRTPRGGVHIWVALPHDGEIAQSCDSIAAGVDVLGTSSVVPMPGSRTSLGEYGAESNFTLLAAPPELLKFLPCVSRQINNRPLAPRTSRWGQVLIARLCAEVRTSRYVGEQLNRAAFLAGRRCDQVAEAELTLLVDAAVGSGLKYHEAWSTVTRGYAAGSRGGL